MLTSPRRQNNPLSVFDLFRENLDSAVTRDTQRTWSSFRSNFAMRPSVQETDEGVSVEVPLPGFSDNDIDVALNNNNQIVLRGETESRWVEFKLNFDPNRLNPPETVEINRGLLEFHLEQPDTTKEGETKHIPVT